LAGRPLGTGISRRALIVSAALSIGTAMAMGLVVGKLRLLPLVVLGGVLVVGYNLELFGGRLHNAIGFAASWGAFPVVVGAYAQHWTIPPAVIVAAVAAFLLSLGQRELSTPARMVRRRVAELSARISFNDGSVQELGRAELVAPLERALKVFAYAMVALATALVLAH
jgi:hypothetical protein